MQFFFTLITVYYSTRYRRNPGYWRIQKHIIAESVGDECVACVCYCSGCCIDTSFTKRRFVYIVYIDLHVTLEKISRKIKNQLTTLCLLFWHIFVNACNVSKMKKIYSRYVFEYNLLFLWRLKILVVHDVFFTLPLYFHSKNIML